MSGSPGRVAWRTATVKKFTVETPHAKTLSLDVPGWPGHTAGQHVDIRLTAEDGYQAERSYSIGSPPEEEALGLTVQRIDDGEVSPYLNDELQVGDELELRGPIGGYFTWRNEDGGPLVLIAGGSGLVPLMAMLRHRVAASSSAQAYLLLSVRSLDDVLYRDELDSLEAVEGISVWKTFTTNPPIGWNGFGRRIDAEMLRDVSPDPATQPRIYLCGPTGLVEAAANLLVGLGHAPAAIRAERFGPTG